MRIASLYALCSCSRMRAAKACSSSSGSTGTAFCTMDGAVVEVLVNEVHGAARDFYAVVERLFLRLQSRKRRQQRRVDVQDSIGELLHKPRREQAHVSCEAYEINLVLTQGLHDFAVVLFADLCLWME